MLRISKKADYAVFLLGAIARQGAYPGASPENLVLSAQDIAKQAGLNKSVVANLLKDCARHDLLRSTRGLRGGYRLARQPGDITLGQILEAVEGKFALADCCSADLDPASHAAAAAPSEDQAPSKTSADCALIASCPCKHPMRIVHERMVQLFDEIRLDELCAMTPVSAAPTARATERAGTRP